MSHFGTKINMSCGQTALYPECLAALGKQLVTPLYYQPYWEIEDETIQLIKTIIHTESDILLITGTATYGTESIINSALEKGEKILHVNSGVFGGLLGEVAKISGAQPIQIWVERGDSVKPERIREELRKDPEIKMVAACFVETSTGTINPIAEIAEVVREFPNVLYMVDAVSAVGAIDIRMDEWGIDFLCSSGQKTLNAPQGVAIVAVSKRGWEKIDMRKTPIPTICLDLTVWRDYHTIPQRSLAGKPSTYFELAGDSINEDVTIPRFKASHGPSPSYIVIKGLHASLKAITEEGLSKVYLRHKIASMAIRSAVRSMGFEVLASEDNAAPCCTVIKLPGDYCDVRKISERMRNEHGIAIGLGSSRKDILGYVGIRVGNMGFVSHPNCVLPLISGLEQVLITSGYEVKKGEGIKAAQDVFTRNLII